MRSSVTLAGADVVAGWAQRLWQWVDKWEGGEEMRKA